MRNYIILNGNNSNTISGLLIQSLPPISKPLMRTAIEEIDGRDGDIVTNLGYSAYDKEVSIGLYGTYDVDEVIKYFNDNSKGQVTFSNEPDKYYNYEIINQIDFERLIRFKTAIVTLHCQPFKYPTEETPVEINIQNITNEAEEMDLDNTADASMKLELKGNTSQASDPTPDSPVDVNVVSGDNTIEITNNIFDNTNPPILNGYISAQNSIVKIGTSQSDRITYISCKPNTTYIVKRKYITSSFRLATYDSTPIPTMTSTDTNYSVSNAINDNSGYSLQITTGANAKFLLIQYGNSTNDTNLQQCLNTLQIADQINTQLISLGVENLFDKDITPENYVYNNSGVKVSTDDPCINQEINNINSSSIYISFSSITGTPYVRVCEYNSSGTFIKRTLVSTNQALALDSNTRKLIFSVNASSTNNFTDLMIEKGSKKNSYSPYGTTPIELCSSSDGTKKDGLIYDLSTDKLYKYSEIGKAVLDGSEDEGWTLNSSGTYKMFSDDNLVTDYLITSNNICLCNYYKSKENVINNSGASSTNNTICFRNDNSIKRIYITNDNITSASDFKTWLSTHNTIVYYVLATPTTIEIDNDKLKQQVKALYQNAKSYDPITHITQNANDKPFILNATAVQKGTDTGIVDNDGNIYSKPTLDIEGNGIVAIYLNGNQMFSVDLSNSDECIIDVTNLEAYDPETNDLMNRQVTGDYSKFILPVGENTVKVSGNVTKATITDYVRWL